MTTRDRAVLDSDHRRPPRSFRFAWPLALLAFGVPPALAPATSQETRPPSSVESRPRDSSLEALIGRIRSAQEIPALGAAIVRGDRVDERAVVGVRKAASAEIATVEDLWHVGSCTKSMTATLIARLVERGSLAWSTTIGEVFPEACRDADAAWRGVTLELLLSHRAGVPADLRADGLWGRLRTHPGTPTEQRLALVEGVLAHSPESPPGTRHVYANGGFAIAGAMAEKVAGKPWETLMREEVFGPLGMKTAGFGAPGERGVVSQPRGHRWKGAEIEAIEPGPGSDNPAAIGPAGTVHASLDDLAKYASLHLAGARGRSDYLKTGTFERLHTPVGDGNYAFGWVARERKPEALPPVKTLWHNGSNTMWFAEIEVVPEKDFALVAVCNDGTRGRAACGALMSALLRRALEK